MAYRFVQEAMTNAFRHAGATRIEASLKFEAPVETPDLRDPELAGLIIRVADDGRGLQGEAEPGMGLVGMRDRVRLMGGSVSIELPQAGGVVLEARFATARLGPRAGIFPDLCGNQAWATFQSLKLLAGPRAAILTSSRVGSEDARRLKLSRGARSRLHIAKRIKSRRGGEVMTTKVAGHIATAGVVLALTDDRLSG